MNTTVSKPLVSVIITCYNNGLYIGQAIDSVLEQSYLNLEVIIINDGSTDDSQHIIKTFEDCRINLINQPNQGVIAARNNGIKKAKGLYFLPLDGDDYLDSSFIEKAVFYLQEQSRLGFISCYCRIFYTGGNEYIWREDNLDLLSFLINTRVVSTCLIRRSCWEDVGGYDPVMNEGFEDYEFFVSILSKGWLAHKIPEVLFHYRRHNTGSRDTNARLNSVNLKLRIFDKHQDLYTKHSKFVFEELNKEVFLLSQEIKEIKNSESYKLGNRIVKFFKKFI